MTYEERDYRKKTHARGLVSFRVAVKETDLWVSAERALERETRDLVFDCRNQIEAYMEAHPEFATSLAPLAPDPYAPPVVREMMEASGRVGVGPMASVAGAVAQFVGKGLLRVTDQAIVENGGDIFLQANRDVTVSLFAGSSPLSEKFGLKVPAGRMPLGVCSSSGTIGHSLSMGIADVVCLLSPSATLADAAATALGNRIRTKGDLAKGAQWSENIEGIIGGVIIVRDRMAAWGEVELVKLTG